jgi:uncharacterized membrane protein YvbJ
MNKNTLVSIFVIVVVIILGIIFWKYSAKNQNLPETPVQALDKETQADTTDQIDSNLDSVNVDTNTDADLKAIDDQLNNL